MKKFAIFAIAAMLCVSFAASQADAGAKIRVGGGMIFDGSIPGGGVAVDIPMSDKPYGITLSTEYYKKSGVTLMPVRIMAMFMTPAGEKADFYLGAGSGLYYTKVKILAASASTTKALGTAVAGINFKASESFGIYIEGGIDRALTSGASNDIGARAGISFGVGE